MKLKILPLLLAFSLNTFSALTGPAPLLPPVPAPGAPAPVPNSSISSSFEPSSSSASAQSEFTSLRQADSLFALGKWNNAQIAYEAQCPQVPVAKRLYCNLQAIRALGESPSGIDGALARLDSLLIRMEPEDRGYGDYLQVQTLLHIRKRDGEKAYKSWKLAKDASLPGQDESLKALCIQIRSLWKDSTLSADCNRLKPLSKQLTQALSPTSTASGSSAKNTSSSAFQSTIGESSWVLQFGAFSNKDNAELLLQNLKSRKVPSRIVTRNSADRVLYLVQTEPFASKTLALEYGQKNLTPLGLDYQSLPSQ